MRRTNIYLDEVQLQALKHLAADERCSVADLVRKAVDDYLSRSLTGGMLSRERLDALLEQVGARTSEPDREPRSSTGNDPVLGIIVERLVDELRPDRIYLFGSRARGEEGGDSDYDIMVVVPTTGEPGYRLAQRAHGLLWDLGTAVDVLVWNREAFDSRLRLKASLPATITREGRLLYAS